MIRSTCPSPAIAADPPRNGRRFSGARNRPLGRRWSSGGARGRGRQNRCDPVGRGGEDLGWAGITCARSRLWTYRAHDGEYTLQYSVAKCKYTSTGSRADSDPNVKERGKTDAGEKNGYDRCRRGGYRWKNTVSRPDVRYGDTATMIDDGDKRRRRVNVSERDG